MSNSTRQLVSALEEKGVDVTVFTTNLGWNAEDARKLKSEKLHIFKAAFDNNFDFSVEMIKRFYGVCKNYDLIHFNSIYSVSTVFGAHAARKSNTPYIVLPQGNFIPLFKRQKGVRSVVKKILFFNLFSRRVLVNADKVVCNSESEKKSVCNQIRTNNLVCIGNGLDTSIYLEPKGSKIVYEKLGIKEGTPIFLFLGRLAEEKAIPFLLDVWGRVVQRMPNAVLVVCGESYRGSYAKIKEKVRRLNRPESVLIPGVISGELKIALLQNSKCLLLPSYFESFGNVVLEALGSGIPVIASEGTPWRVLEETHLGKWLPWDVETWEEAMLEMVNDGTYYGKSFAERSRQWVKDNFSWQKISDEYIDLYEEIIRGRKNAIYKTQL
ncbi:MAG: glycosyltransferase family 4 protein [Candidatus Omnitrophica bacterium]|nr:glycosyltransferase family 4 protein [Candidatus Omnitrophota bacterium]MBU1127563.1 glycosyltransferase family 4 protein [Candidatus Omnitrophota bacterium]